MTTILDQVALAETSWRLQRCTLYGRVTVPSADMRAVLSIDRNDEVTVVVDLVRAMGRATYGSHEVDFNVLSVAGLVTTGSFAATVIEALSGRLSLTLEGPVLTLRRDGSVLQFTAL